MSTLSISSAAAIAKTCLVASILVLTPLAANADTYYYILGKIVDINNQSISVADRYYPFSPTVKIHGLDGKKSGLDGLEVGDPVKLTIMTLDRKRLVDRIDSVPESDLGSGLRE